jgi:NADH-quinone oxidoreductase subunit M
LTTLGFFAAIGLPGLAGFVSEAMTLLGAFNSADKRFHTLVIISVLGIVFTAAFLLWAMQRVFLGKLNAKYEHIEEINFRELVCQVPLLALCVVFGILPWYLTDWMHPSVTHLLEQLK